MSSCEDTPLPLWLETHASVSHLFAHAQACSHLFAVSCAAVWRGWNTRWKGQKLRFDGAQSAVLREDPPLTQRRASLNFGIPHKRILVACRQINRKHDIPVCFHRSHWIHCVRAHVLDTRGGGCPWLRLICVVVTPAVLLFTLSCRIKPHLFRSVCGSPCSAGDNIWRPRSSSPACACQDLPSGEAQQGQITWSDAETSHNPGWRPD